MSVAAIGGIVYFLVIYVFNYASFLVFSKGLSRQSRGLQSRRYFFTSLFASLPFLLWVPSVLQDWLQVLSAFVAAEVAQVYLPLFYFTNRKESTEIDLYHDTAFSLYALAALNSLLSLQHLLPAFSGAASVLIAFLELVLIMLSLAQVVYYKIYDGCIDNDGMKTIVCTDVNEVFSYFGSLPLVVKGGLALLLPSLLAVLFLCNSVAVKAVEGSEWQVALMCVLLFFTVYYLFRPVKGLFYRTGVVALYLVEKDYLKVTENYGESQKKRYETLEVLPLKKEDGPVTYVMVIGESACRDFCSAFTPMEHDTTPWLRSKSEEDAEHFFLFHNAYSCAVQTVPSLERALTERNQYNDLSFAESCSVVDVAHKMGFKVHWYSNQGHYGAADTPVSLVAETSDVAKWTNQKLNTVLYDEELLPFLDEVDPGVNNLLVVHLKGSHFNFECRYPKTFEKWGNENSGLTYENSICYTDYILKTIHEYASAKLNMRAMLYFSDHGTFPGKVRSPKMRDFTQCRIPMFIYLSEEYRRLHAERYEAVAQNHDKFFTNDLVYELVCSLFDIAPSPNFCPENSIGDLRYKYDKYSLLTYDGRIEIKTDPYLGAGS